MKKTISFLIAFVLIFSFLIIPVNAEEILSETPDGTVVDIEYLSDGSYIITYLDNGVIYGDDTDSTVTVTKTKTKKFYNSEGVTMWYVRVIGTFKYDGSTSKCTEVGHAASAPGSTWSIISASSSKSGNHATATATARHTLGNSYSDYTRSVTLTCSPTGVFS